MSNWLLKAGKWLCAGLRFAVLAVPFCLAQMMPSGVDALSLRHRRTSEADAARDRQAENFSQSPAFSIAVEPLGFSAPGPFYLGQRESLASLDFLDEDRLLFTFRAPGLIHRSNQGGQERQIHAEVLTLPQGSVEAEAVWTLRDRERYVWMLHDGHFLLRDGNILKEGDSTLALKPLLEFPGPLLWLDTDPAEQYLVTDSEEPADLKPKAGQVGSPSTARAEVTTDDTNSPSSPDVVLRILRRSSGQVMLVSRVRTTVHLPINSAGYLEPLHGGKEREWLVNLHEFTGSSKVLGKVESVCEPPMQFVAPTVAVANLCAPEGGRDLVAFSTDGHRLWDARQAPGLVWPLLIPSPNGQRLVRETLKLDQPVTDAFHPIDTDSIKGQVVEIFDAATGKLVLKAAASPVLDAGGNVALSPSARRAAVLHAGAIRIYELSPAAAIAEH